MKTGFNATDRQQMRLAAFHDLVFAGDVEGARAMMDSEKVNINGAIGRWTALCHAAQAGNVPMVALLLDYGANVGAVGYGYGEWTALHYAAFHDRPDVVDMLLKAGASPLRRSQSLLTPRDLVMRDDQGRIRGALQRAEKEWQEKVAPQPQKHEYFE